MPPGMEPIQGIEQWSALMVEFFGFAEVSNIETRTASIEVVGDWAFEWHTEAATYTDSESGASERDHNKGMWVFRREPAGWKIVRYIWNETPGFD